MKIETLRNLVSYAGRVHEEIRRMKHINYTAQYFLEEEDKIVGIQVEIFPRSSITLRELERNILIAMKNHIGCEVYGIKMETERKIINSYPNKTRKFYVRFVQI